MAGAPAPPGGAFWDSLLKGQYQQLQALELAAMGKVCLTEPLLRPKT